MHQADGCTQIDEGGGDVEIFSKLRGRVVVGEGVVVVVESLAQTGGDHEGRLAGLDALVVWARAKVVGGTVDQPSAVQGDQVADHEGEHEGAPEALVPE